MTASNDRRDETPADALARLYDLDLLRTTRATSTCTWRSRPRPDGPILELVAGSGRLAVPLAAAGHRVTAVDLDPAMLAARRPARGGRRRRRGRRASSSSRGTSRGRPTVGLAAPLPPGVHRA